MRNLYAVLVFIVAGLLAPMLNWIGVTHDSLLVDFIHVSWPFLIFGPYESSLSNTLISAMLVAPNVVLYGVTGAGVVFSSLLLTRVLFGSSLLLMLGCWGLFVVDSWQGVLMTWVLVILSMYLSILISVKR